jgi:hypothetical protein
MLKLAGHKDVTLYEMQGYDHGAMPQPAYKILKDHIKRIVTAMAQGTEINSRDLRGKVVYQDDEVVFRQLDEHTWIGNGHRVYNNGNNGGMDMMVDDKGVRINFSSRFGMK